MRRSSEAYDFFALGLRCINLAEVTRLLKLKEMEVAMRGAENDEPEMSFRHGYRQGAIDVFYAITWRPIGN